VPDWLAIVSALEDQGVKFRGSHEARPVGGGDISAAWRLETGNESLFIKTGPAAAMDMFAAEADGLNELARAKAVRVPKVIGCGLSRGSAFIALEWLRFSVASAQTESRFGTQLAALHRHRSDRYGWHRNNTIGRTPQNNPWTEDWIAFFRKYRLGFQLRLAAENGYGGELQALGKKLVEGLPALFVGYDPVPSLLHGDLWGGNWASVDGDPVIFDPAVYYGDRETDLAMTRLFGGFGAAFYESYQAAWPLEDGSAQRQELYRLYHILNHLNLFGGSYRGSAVSSLRMLVAPL
jgi:fructosamine-3-kinase